MSVIVPTWQRAELLARAVASVLAQTRADLELLVVDDGSTDGTAERFGRHPDPRLRLLHQPHRGVSAARNLGAREARGELLTFLDSDDEADPRWLERLTAPLAAPGVGIACCGARALTRPAEDRAADARAATDRPANDRAADDLDAAAVELLLPRPRGPLYGGGPISYTSGTLAVRRSLFLDAGGYTDGLAFAENTELALRLVPLCLERSLSIAVVPEALVTYHRRAGTWSGDPARVRLVREASETILARHGARMRAVHPAAYANYRGVAAVNAARLGDVAAARRHLAAALRVRPWHWKHYPRLALTLVPPLALRVWNRPAAAPAAGELA